MSIDQQADYFPWSRLMEIDYELWRLDMEEKHYAEVMAAIDADGGDISHLLYPDPNGSNPA